MIQMPKTLKEIENKSKDLVPNIWKGVSPAEIEFVKKLTSLVKLINDPAKNGDDVFKASNLERDPEKGMFPGDDVKAYDDWNKNLKP